MLKPRENYDDLVEHIVLAWSREKTLRVPGLSPARLRRLLSDAERAKAKEMKLRTDFERRIAPISDARLRAEHDLWRAVLDLHAAVKLYARHDQALGERFAFLSEAFSGRTGTSASTRPPPDTSQPS